MIKRISFTVVAVLAFSLAAHAADMYLHIGTWVQNVAKSTSSNGNLRRSGGQVISMDGDSGRLAGGWKGPMKRG